VVSGENALGAVPVAYVFDISSCRLAMELNQEEDALIDFYRAMSPADRAALLHVARSMADRADIAAKNEPKGFSRRPRKK